MAFERHATSKITNTRDLFDIQTLGFRGEALASIAAVAKVSCTTRTASQDFGMQAKVEGGEILDVREAATPIGTTLLVKELFYNVPVRLKFLKKASLEASMVTDFMTRLILSKPDISFRYVNDGRTVYQRTGDGSIESALLCCFGKETFRGMKRVQGNINGVLLEGYVGVGDLARGNRQHQSFFVNGRFFRDAELSKALDSACRGVLMTGRFPSCALYLQLPYDKIDVNVHPNKLEVRFQNIGQVAEAVEDIVRMAMSKQNLGDVLRAAETQKPSTSSEESIEVVVLKEDGLEEPNIEKTPQHFSSDLKIQVDEENNAIRPAILPAVHKKPVFRQEHRVIRMTPMQASASEEESILTVGNKTDIKYVGSAFQTYLLFETGDRFLWVDQHAAHERIIYDRLWKQYDSKNVSQPLLSPQLVPVSPRERAMLLECQSVLEAAGFNIQPFDDLSVAVHAIPTLFGKNEPVEQLLLETLEQRQTFGRDITRERMRKHVAQMACKRAVKAGDPVSADEVKHLLETMLIADLLPTCPHGRPIVVEVNRQDIEKKFKRNG